MILTWLILIPVIGGVLAWLAARWNALAARWIALGAMALEFVLAVALWVRYPVTLTPGTLFLEQKAEWIPSLGISYHLAMDGFSLLLILLTAFLGMISVAASWREIQDRVGLFHLSMLMLLAGVVGVFLAFDLILFYLFWELMLIPMYIVIALWGHENRVYAAIKFFLFTFISGLLMLVAMLGLYFAHGSATGNYTFDLTELAGAAIPLRLALWLMLGFFVAFAVKLPAFPFHTWLPDAHTEAPTAGSVILAGLMLKTGAYGMMRFAIPIFPVVSANISQIAMGLGVAGILYGAMLAFAQQDFKRTVAYTSVSHLGFVLLGIYSGNRLALQGAVMEIIAHGIATGALFLIAGMLQERTHTREFRKLGGLWVTVPKMGGFTLFFALAALGLPGLGNFIGEFLILVGVFQVSPVMSILAALGLVMSVAYSLRLVQLSMQGPNINNWTLPDLSPREIAILGSLAATILWLGLYPRPIFNTAAPSLDVIEQALPGTDAQEAGNTQ